MLSPHSIICLATAAALSLADRSCAEDTTGPNAGKTRLEQKLNRIVVPRIAFREATVREAFDFLRHKCAELDTAEPDPAKRGINVVLFNLPSEAPGGANPDEARITVELSNVPLAEAFKYVTGLANLKFQVSNYAIEVAPLNSREPVPAPKAQLAPDAARAAAKLEDKLNLIIIPRLEFREATVREALDFLRKKVVELDSAESDVSKRGVNMVLKLPPSPAAAPAPQPIPGLETGAPAGLPPENPNEPRVTLSLRNIPFLEAFKYVTRLANLTLTIEPHGIVIAP